MKGRVFSVDLLRGVVMILMALDHTRDYFTNLRFPPEDLSRATPALFATEWAKRFFDRFLDGQALGDTFLELRREFLEQHNNPLGLLYAVHCDGDTRIQPKC